MQPNPENTSRPSPAGQSPALVCGDFFGEIARISAEATHSAANRRKTGWRELDEAFESTRKLLNQIERDHPKLHKEALRRHRQEQENIKT